MPTILAVIQGRDLVGAVVSIIVLGLVFWLLSWLLTYCAIPEPFNKIARVVIAIVAVLVLIGILLSIAGYRFVAW